MALILRELRHGHTLCTAMAEYQADILAAAFQTVKQWGEFGMQSAMVWAVPVRKLLQIKDVHTATILAVHRDRVAVLDTVANRSVRAVDVHVALLSGGYYSANETETNSNYGRQYVCYET
ncbi:hypothetical protein D6J61_25775 [Salmonella enterica subsp. enterica serovar Alachua]|nr:hypothetical protein [Salmonella enterica subsp. enterica serovar Alachua]